MRTPVQAVVAAHGVSRYPEGYCLRFVREQWGVGPLYGSAIEAWNGARFKHPGDRNPPTAAPCFYLGGRYGHIVLACPDSHLGIRSTDAPSSGVVSDESLSWCERTWGYRYLGWTEDLNGVRVIRPKEEDDMPNYRDWSELDRRALARDVADAVWERETEVKKPDGTKAKKPALSLVRETWQRVAKN